MHEEGKALKQEMQIPEGFIGEDSSAFGYKAIEASPIPRKEGTVTILR